MFKEEYLLELLSRKLTSRGYASILGTIASMVRKYQWKRNIIVSDHSDNDWQSDDIKELSHQFFEWVISKNKIKYLSKVPFEYLSYYFTQMFISFVSTRIKEEQQKVGLSYQKCQELVQEICQEDYKEESHEYRTYVKSSMSDGNNWIDNLDDIVKYLAHYPIKEDTKHFKPIVKLAIGDVLLSADGYVSIQSLTKAVFELLDQSVFKANEPEIQVIDNHLDDEQTKAIKTIIEDVSQVDARIFLEYIFQNTGGISLSSIADKYNLPKSSVHRKIEDFKKKIFSTYVPNNEVEGISFLQNIALALDKISESGVLPL